MCRERCNGHLLETRRRARPAHKTRLRNVKLVLRLSSHLAIGVHCTSCSLIQFSTRAIIIHDLPASESHPSRYLLKDLFVSKPKTRKSRYSNEIALTLPVQRMVELLLNRLATATSSVHNALWRRALTSTICKRSEQCLSQIKRGDCELKQTVCLTASLLNVTSKTTWNKSENSFCK